MISLTVEERREFVDKNISFESNDFKIGEKVFKEAIECFINGQYRSCLVMSTVALESVLKNDYIYFLPDFTNELGDIDNRIKRMEDKKQTMYNLVGEYFSPERYGRLPPTENTMQDQILLIRNSIVHSKNNEVKDYNDEKLLEFAKRNLLSINLLLDHIKMKVESIGRCGSCQSELKYFPPKDSIYGTPHIRCTKPTCGYNKSLYPDEKPLLNNRNKVCLCGRPLVSGKTKKRTDSNRLDYARCLENCNYTPVRCPNCKGPGIVKFGKFGKFIKCKTCGHKWS